MKGVIPSVIPICDQFQSIQDIHRKSFTHRVTIFTDIYSLFPTCVLLYLHVYYLHRLTIVDLQHSVKILPIFTNFLKSVVKLLYCTSDFFNNYILALLKFLWCNCIRAFPTSV